MPRSATNTEPGLTFLESYTMFATGIFNTVSDTPVAAGAGIGKAFSKFRTTLPMVMAETHLQLGPGYDDPTIRRLLNQVQWKCQLLAVEQLQLQLHEGAGSFRV